VADRAGQAVGLSVAMQLPPPESAAPGWNKLIGQLRQVTQRGVTKVDAVFQFGMMGWNLLRMRNILAMASP
jgi:hypothetical protein